MDLWIVQMVASFIVGGFFIAFITVFSERVGTRLGSVLAGSPSTVVVSLFFQGLAVNVDHAVMASSAALGAMGVFGLFLSAFIYFSSRGFWIALGGACVVWVLCIAPLVWWDIKDLALTIPVFLGLTLLAYLFLRRIVVEDHAPSKDAHSYRNVLVRFVIGGGVIALSVVAGVVAGETLGGIASSFPAVAISSLLLLYYSSGMKFTVAVARGTFASAAITLPLYLLCVYTLYPIMGLWWGTLLSYMIALVAVYIFMRVKMSARMMPP